MRLLDNNHLYLLGLFQTDGSLYKFKDKDKYKLSLEISIRDLDVINKIEEILSPIVHVTKYYRTRDTNFKKDYKSVAININTKDFLKKYFTPFIPVGRKSETITPPVVKFQPDYLRGIYDGDGSLGITSNNRAFMSLCTKSERLKEYLVGTLIDVIGIELNISRNVRDDAYNICIYDEAAVKFSELLYANCCTCLDRKHNAYLKLKNWKRTANRRLYSCKTWEGWEDLLILSEELTIAELEKKLTRTSSSIKTRKWRLNKTT